jgi:hypothetical protein
MTGERLAAETDIPSMPEDHHMTIVWRRQRYASHEGAAKVKTDAEKEYARALRSLERDQLPLPNKVQVQSPRMSRVPKRFRVGGGLNVVDPAISSRRARSPTRRTSRWCQPTAAIVASTATSDTTVASPRRLARRTCACRSRSVAFVLFKLATSW